MKKQARILIVDDHAVFRSGLRVLLEKEKDFKVVGEAENGEIAIDLVSKLSPDIVVMDITMPDLDGIEATRQIMSEFPHTKVVALSIHSEKRFIRGMLQAGAAAYILKESASQEIIKAIQNVLANNTYLSPSISRFVVSDYSQILSETGDIPEMSSDQILRTKLHRPPVGADVIPRARLVNQLEEGRDRALTLISAPAGYGKSVLASQWLQSCPFPNAWVSLDESDNDLREFLTYFSAAIQSVFPSLSMKSQSLLRAGDLPPLKVLVRYILNDLDHVETPFILVLDDYHRIKENAVHALLKGLLHHPSPVLHLALLTRQIPPLPLASLRAYGLLTEIAVDDLRFTSDETSVFLERVLRVTIDTGTASVLEEKLEGWVSGLRLTTLSLRQKKDPDRILKELRESTYFAQDYLIKDVLSHIPKDLTRYLMEMSIVNRFCAPLCDALHAVKEEQKEEVFTGQAFIDWLEETHLFVIPLDDENRWFRYHHLFQQMLRDQLKQDQDPEEVAGLCSRASDWFFRNGLIEEAIQCSLEAGDAERAGWIVESNRHSALSVDRWYTVEKWLSYLPDDVIQRSPDLLLSKAWVLNHRYQLMEIPPLIERVEQMLERESDKPALRGELNFFKGFLCFWQGQTDLSMKYCRKAQDQIPEESKYALIRGDNEIYYAMALQASGKGKAAARELSKKIGGFLEPQGMYFSRLVASLAFVHLLSGELKQVEQVSLLLENISQKNEFSYANSWSQYWRACYFFHISDLDNAVRFFSRMIEHKYIMHTAQALSCLGGLSLTFQSLGQKQAAEDTWEQLRSFAFQTDDVTNIAIAESTRARLSLLQGDLDTANSWERSFHAPLHPSSFFVWLELPHITQCRVLVARGSEDSLHIALGLLKHLSKTAGAIHNVFHLVDVFVLQALALSKLLRRDQALEKLTQAIDLAKPGGWIRPFIEPGPSVIELLKQLQPQSAAEDHIEKILTVFQRDMQREELDVSDFTAAASSALKNGLSPQKLSNRELDVLTLLAEGLSNKEIASKLFVSYVTAKKHVYNIYQKLDVHTRTAAMNKARELGILSPY